MILKSNVLSKQGTELKSYLESKVIGQNEAIYETVMATQKYFVGLSQTKKPICTFLFIGPTGTGKTKLVEEFFQFLVPSEYKINKYISLIKVNCGEFQSSHEIAKLVGAPPGYVGHNDTKPYFNKEAIESVVPNVILFDEIEKASDSMFNILLGILDKGELRLGNNSLIDLSKSFIFMTSNEGMGQLQKEANLMGFLKNDVTTKVDSIVQKSLKNKFKPEFLNRVDRIITFNHLSIENIVSILDLELAEIQNRILKSTRKKMFFVLTDECKHYLAELGNSTEYGARNLKRVLEKEIVYPLSNIILSDDTAIGDVIHISYEKEKLVFRKHQNKKTLNYKASITI